MKNKKLLMARGLLAAVAIAGLMLGGSGAANAAASTSSSVVSVTASKGAATLPTLKVNCTGNEIIPWLKGGDPSAYTNLGVAWYLEADPSISGVAYVPVDSPFVFWVPVTGKVIFVVTATVGGERVYGDSALKNLPCGRK